MNISITELFMEQKLTWGRYLWLLLMIQVEREERCLAVYGNGVNPPQFRCDATDIYRWQYVGLICQLGMNVICCLWSKNDSLKKASTRMHGMISAITNVCQPNLLRKTTFALTVKDFFFPFPLVWTTITNCPVQTLQNIQYQDSTLNIKYFYKSTGSYLVRNENNIGPK